MMPFTDDEVNRIVEARDSSVPKASSFGNRRRTLAFVYILKYTGLRISDAALARYIKGEGRPRLPLHTEDGDADMVPVPAFVDEELEAVPCVSDDYLQP